MSVAPYYPEIDPRALLPQTAGPSPYPAGTLFLPCPGNGQPWGSAHVRPTFLAMKACKQKKIGGYRVYVYCAACGFRGFFAGEWWARGGVTRESILSQFGPGVAVDDTNGLFL